MKYFIVFLLVCSLFSGCQQNKLQENDQESFSFVFMTDIHLQPELNATEGFLQAIDTINKLNPDFVLTGGDNIRDALGKSHDRSDSLYSLYQETIKKLTMPVYSGIGNHDVFGLYEKSGISPEHEEYGKKMFERLAKPYYSFKHKNWHFIVLDGIGLTEDRHYYGHIDSIQVKWLKKELESIGKEKPVGLSIHIPLLSIANQIQHGPTVGFKKSSVVMNSREIIDIIEDYNVKFVLQGHLHFLEDITYNNIHYITGGALSAKWWRGATNENVEEGFVLMKVKGEDFSWEYVDFGWEALD